MENEKDFAYTPESLLMDAGDMLLPEEGEDFEIFCRAIGQALYWIDKARSPSLDVKQANFRIDCYNEARLRLADHIVNCAIKNNITPKELGYGE